MKPMNIINRLNEDEAWDARYQKYLETQKAFAENLDLEPLYNKIREMVGDNSIQFKSEIRKGSYGYYIVFESDNIVDKCGIFQLAISELYVGSFSTGIVIDNEKEFLNGTDAELKEPRYWTTVDFSYRSHSGGTNGMEILSAFYNEDESHEWIFKENGKKE